MLESNKQSQRSEKPMFPSRIWTEQETKKIIWLETLTIDTQLSLQSQRDN